VSSKAISDDSEIERREIELWWFGLLPNQLGGMPKEEARNKRGSPEHLHEGAPTPYSPIVVVGLFIKS
jgi:hypothetical protein